MENQNLILFDDVVVRENLLPLSFTRPLSHLRVGITTIEEKWIRRMAPSKVSHMTVPYLEEKFPCVSQSGLFVAGHVVPSAELAEAVSALDYGEALVSDAGLIAFRGTADDFRSCRYAATVTWSGKVTAVTMLYDIFMLNGQVLADDYRDITAGRRSQPLSHTCTVVGDMTDADGMPMIFIEEGATVEGAVINVKNGPVYIGRDAEVMEGSCMRGPVAMLPHSVANMGAKIYGATTLGPYCKVGGELNNVVMIGYSNKAHDGFLGNAVIGKWCNLGAGCVASNLKNDYTEIKLWNYRARRFMKTGLQFCGLIMGDHSKAGINTMFNTATV
ncbi:MAG: glucose-1-phosphate thymidylyltransferase, partial [Muribaculaceae bacterium]|nr:glucose-1-phosphate thymidylyltransferase [Muribaculaceae bacterium]